MKVSLVKQESVSLTKKNEFFSDIFINLNWNRKSGGLLGLMGLNSAIDLDLGCLYELKDGNKGCVQALGNSFGRLQEAPYIKLCGDDRSGDNQDGEVMYINGRYWDRVHKVLVYSFIYSGLARWSQADGIVHVKTDGDSLELKLDEPTNGKSMCAVAMLENMNGTIKVTKLNEYFPGHEAMDRHYGWYMDWKPGRK